MDNKNDELYLTKLINADILQQLQDAFSDMTGIAALTADKYGTAVTMGSNFTEFCFKYTRNSELGRRRCEGCDQMGAFLTLEKGESCAYNCHAGLVDFAAPIMANGEIIGSFIGGQVLTSPPDFEKFRNVAFELGIDPDEYVAAVKKVKIVSKSFVARVAHCLSVIASVLSTIAYNGYQMRLNNIEIEKAAKAKSDFLANMSHEIRTPMNAVLGMAEMALREEMSPAAREYIHQIKFSGNNLLTIINDILDFSKIESGKMDIVPVTYEPMSVTNDLASIVCTRIGDKDIEFIMDIDPGIPHKLVGDSVRIQQILVNLLNNAVKFTKRGQVKLEMYYEKTDDPDIITIIGKVSDTGIGIKEEDMEKLFISFQQVDSKRNRNIEGTGLGLPISKQLLEQMGGSISVESEYNKGTTFSFRLPQKVMADAAPPELPEPVSAAILIDNKYVKAQLIKDLDRIGVNWTDVATAASFADKHYDFFIAESHLFSEKAQSFFLEKAKAKCILIENFGGMSDIGIPGITFIRKPVYFLNLYAAMGIINEYVRESNTFEDDFYFTAPEARVLIVDDNAVNLAVAKGLIEPLNMRVDTAMSAAETIDRIKDVKYDVIFMDHMMPEVDGIETTHIIRRLMPSYADTPIIALTANALEGTREMFIREGMNDFVAKPIDVKEITSKLRKWLPQEKLIPADNQDAAAKAGSSKGSGAAEVTDPVLGIKELNTASAVDLLGSAELYKSVLREYYIAIDKKSASIEEHFKKENWKNYTIEVHALKSTSRQIGAEELSALAAEMELAGNAGDVKYIKEKTAGMLEQYRAFKEILAPYFPDYSHEEYKKPAEPVDIVHMLDELQDALENFDTLLIDEVIEKMSGYQFDTESEEFFGQIKLSAEDSDIDFCAEIARQWRETIIQSYIIR